MSSSQTETMATPPHKTSRSLSITRTLTTTSVSRLKSVTTTAQPSLDDLKLSHILNGETCPPISFHDFAGFITHKEITSENLLFVVWFRSYQGRYHELEQSVRQRVPVPSTKRGDRYAPFAYLDNNAAVVDPLHDHDTSPISAKNPEPEIVFSLPFSSASAPLPPTHRRAPSRGDFRPCAWTEDGQPCSCGDPSHCHNATSSKPGFFGFSRRGPSPQLPQRQQVPTSTPQPILHTSMHPTLPPQGTVMLEPADQPMREEAQRAFATFLRPGGSKELGIADELRQFAKDCLARSTAPEVFLPIYEDIYHTIETQSLPHFLSYAKTNINRPKQLFWYIVGAVDFLIGVFIYLLLTFLLSPRHFGLRATRLPSGIFAAFGAMQFYSAARGFCNQVWGRSSRQVRPWEMDEYEADEEDRAAIVQAPVVPDTRGGGLSSDKSADADDELRTSVEDGDHSAAGGTDLPTEVHPLTDLGGTVTQPTLAIPWQTEFLSSAAVGEEASPTGSFLSPDQGLSTKGSTESLSETAKRQLALRRATVKVPDASLAFPISETTPSSTTAALLPLSATQRNRSEITPFDFLEPPLPRSSSSSSPPSRRERRGDATTTTQERRTKVFGPERLVEDPRIKRLYKSIVRDILIVGGITGAIWVAICLAVPMQGDV